MIKFYEIQPIAETPDTPLTLEECPSCYLAYPADIAPEWIRSMPLYCVSYKIVDIDTACMKHFGEVPSAYKKYPHEDDGKLYFCRFENQRNQWLTLDDIEPYCATCVTNAYVCKRKWIATIDDYIFEGDLHKYNDCLMSTEVAQIFIRNYVDLQGVFKDTLLHEVDYTATLEELAESMYGFERVLLKVAQGKQILIQID